MRGGTVFVCVVFILSAVGTGLGQDVVDNSNCEENNVHCPKDGQPSYKKYCCVENDGGLTLYNCCNPYFGLIIGISVGIPIIIVIIVTLIVTYCLCHRYHSRRMQSLMAMYHRRRREEDRQREVNLLAPPPYAVLEEDDKRGESTELPIYTEHDPYQSSNTEGDIVGGGEEENVEIGESEGGGEVSIEQSSNSDQSSSDRAPLVDNGEQ